ncbi:hypothetical protein H072_277 [Dactylellina haptotyla CBS 200.50]|uniref:Methyltransferase domain-containing protein n=1 Tax=Dactylellina haptotyla (strain CBS 200.50) TaxID=1284197 RepID=S8CDM9_DACHA|nr:hypothetical protein H072_277 [Dactylellina haptotyla CBS 200.50]
MPPSYGDRSYWDARFLTNPAHFDWLVPAPVLLSLVQSTLSSFPIPQPHILHIGCGTSELSFALRGLTALPSHVFNIDFSPAAIEAGREEERKRYNLFHNNPEQTMRWVSVDLLSLDDVMMLKNGSLAGGYSLIIDKSTSDAISCAEDVAVTLPYPVNAAGTHRPVCEHNETTKVHPMAVLMVHMAALAAHNAKWLVLSYSAHRFDFLSTDAALEDLSAARFINPGLFWRIAATEEIDAREEVPANGSPVVGRPVTKHTLYTLERTGVEVEICPCHIDIHNPFAQTWNRSQRNRSRRNKLIDTSV